MAHAEHAADARRQQGAEFVQLIPLSAFRLGHPNPVSLHHRPHVGPDGWHGLTGADVLVWDAHQHADRNLSASSDSMSAVKSSGSGPYASQ